MSRANSLEVALHIADMTIRNLESRNQALEDDNDRLRDRNASKRSENVLYVEKLDEARAQLAELTKLARASFMTPDKERPDGRTDVWEFDGVCCPVCDVMSSDVLDHLIVENDYEHNRWLGTRLEALRTFLAPIEPKEDDEAWGAVANRGDRHAELTRKSPRSPRTFEVDGGDELATRHDLTCSYDDCIAPPGSEDHQLRDRPIDKLPKDPPETDQWIPSQGTKPPGWSTEETDPE